MRIEVGDDSDRHVVVRAREKVIGLARGGSSPVRTAAKGSMSAN